MRSKPDRSGHAGGHRQLRLVHLEPGPDPGRAGRRSTGLSQRHGHPRGAEAPGDPTAGRVTRAVHSRAGGGQRRGDSRTGALDPDAGRVPRPPVHRRGIRGRTIRATRTVHGKVSPIRHNGDPLFDGIPSPMRVARYHSLVASAELPEGLEVIAWSTDPATRAKFRPSGTVNTRSGVCSFTPSRGLPRAGAGCFGISSASPAINVPRAPARPALRLPAFSLPGRFGSVIHTNDPGLRAPSGALS